MTKYNNQTANLIVKLIVRIYNIIHRKYYGKSFKS